MRHDRGELDFDRQFVAVLRLRAALRELERTPDSAEDRRAAIVRARTLAAEADAVLGRSLDDLAGA